MKKDGLGRDYRKRRYIIEYKNSIEYKGPKSGTLSLI